jgi:apolipoprotein D and lipocalin family protein
LSAWSGDSRCRRDARPARRNGCACRRSRRSRTSTSRATSGPATYTIRGDGDIDVLNRCRKDSLDGKEKSALGRAKVVDRTTNAKLEVSFFRPFWGDYWIIDLDADYRYAVVGHPGREYLWILSRTPTMRDAT